MPPLRKRNESFIARGGTAWLLERYLNLFFDPLLFGSKFLIVDKPPRTIGSGRYRICKINGSEVAASHILENLPN